MAGKELITKTELATLDEYSIFNKYAKNYFYIVFSRSSSKYFPLVLSILEHTLMKEELIINGKKMLVSMINIEEIHNVNAAISAIPMLSNWKGTFYVFQGRLLNNAYTISSVLDCLVDANKCNNHLAHCLHKNQYEFTDENTQKVYKVVFPCRKLELFSFRYRPQIDIPFNDQLQAYAVERGVEWCPNFDIKNTKHIEKTKPDEFESLYDLFELSKY